MGVTDSKLAKRAVKYGVLGEVGAVIGVTAGSRGNAQHPPVVVVVGADVLDQYNAITGDRKLRLKRKAIVTCVDFRPNTTFGFIGVAGNQLGEVVLFDVATLNEFKRIQTNGDANARPRAATVQGVASSPSDATSPAAVYVSAVACSTSGAFFAGHTDGVVRAFALTDGTLQRIFRPPSEWVARADVQRGRDVTAIALYGGGRVAGGGVAPHMVAVGHRDGTVHCYDAGTGAFCTTFTSEPGLTQLLPLRRFATLAAVHAGRNAMQLWDLATNRVVSLDFAAELESVRRRSSRLCVASYDDARGVILVGADDGSVFVRRVTRIAGTNDLAVALARFSAPSAEAAAPSRITSMWFDTKNDALYTGDLSGLVRVLSDLTGVAYRETNAAAREAAEAVDGEVIHFDAISPVNNAALKDGFKVAAEKKAPTPSPPAKRLQLEEAPISASPTPASDAPAPSAAALEAASAASSASRASDTASAPAEATALDASETIESVIFSATSADTLLSASLVPAPATAAAAVVEPAALQPLVVEPLPAPAASDIRVASIVQPTEPSALAAADTSAAAAVSADDAAAPSAQVAPSTQYVAPQAETASPRAHAAALLAAIDASDEDEDIFTAVKRASDTSHMFARASVDEATALTTGASLQQAHSADDAAAAITTATQSAETAPAPEAVSDAATTANADVVAVENPATAEFETAAAEDIAATATEPAPTAAAIGVPVDSAEVVLDDTSRPTHAADDNRAVDVAESTVMVAVHNEAVEAAGSAALPVETALAVTDEQSTGGAVVSEPELGAAAAVPAVDDSTAVAEVATDAVVGDTEREMATDAVVGDTEREVATDAVVGDTERGDDTAEVAGGTSGQATPAATTASSSRGRGGGRGGKKKGKR